MRWISVLTFNIENLENYVKSPSDQTNNYEINSWEIMNHEA